MLKKDLEQELNRTRLILDYAREELKLKDNIIKEVREYIKDNKDKYYRDYSWDESYTDTFLEEIEIDKVLEILDKVGSENNES